MMNGASHSPFSESRETPETSRSAPWSGSAARSGLSEYGSIRSRRASRLRRASSSMPRIESTVPPLMPPRSPTTSVVVSPSSPSVSARTASCSVWTPRSDGIESNPQAWTIRAPLPAATEWKRSIAWRMNSTSPARSA